ncbi:MAG: acyltransferase [Lachnospiraceae bacterium]|nr:acyltransferase [Lachnospiraceae bacterium]
MSKRLRIEAFDFIRVLSMIGIILFHYSFSFVEYSVGGDHLVFALFNTGNWGAMFVAMFFMLSGAALWYNYGEKIDLGRFYLKRWLSLFPMFYTAWLIVYIAGGIRKGNWLFGGPLYKLLYTVFGMDGFFLDPGVNSTYYLLGEWFLGAIIFLYLLFPLVRFLFMPHEKTGVAIRWVFTLILTVIFSMNLYRDWFHISDGKNLISCLMSFWLGMLVIEYYKPLLNPSKKKETSPDGEVLKSLKAGTGSPDVKSGADKVRAVITVLCLVAVILLMYIPIPGFMWKETMMANIAGTLWFIVFMDLGERIMHVPYLSFVIKKLSEYSFGMFLVHHLMIYAVMKRYAMGEVSFAHSIVIYLVILVLTAVLGGLLSVYGSFITGRVLGADKKKKQK